MHESSAWAVDEPDEEGKVEKTSEISVADRISPTGSDLRNDLLKNWKHGPQSAEEKQSGRECKNRNKLRFGKNDNDNSKKKPSLKLSSEQKDQGRRRPTVWGK